MSKARKVPIKQIKEEFLQVYKQNMGLAALSCAAVKISYHTFQKWFAEDEKFRKECLEVDQVQGDYVVNKLMQKIEEGDTTAIIFYLKAKLNWRDRQVLQVEGQVDHNIKQINIHVPDNDTKLLMNNTLKLIDISGKEINE